MSCKRICGAIAANEAKDKGRAGSPLPAVPEYAPTNVSGYDATINASRPAKAGVPERRIHPAASPAICTSSRPKHLERRARSDAPYLGEASRPAKAGVPERRIHPAASRDLHLVPPEPPERRARSDAPYLRQKITTND
ncbi:MAG TPA: hypothetical protein VN829_09580 [Dongiaceae bacterium]|nr:hypothetical protein SBV1_370004 [Verrucomicrobiota bacterium]HXP60731.1 hypothetical protein [Dongiaceae bacterium]